LAVSTLSGAVAVIEQIFRLRIIDGDNRVFKGVGFTHAAQTDDAGGGFFVPPMMFLIKFFTFLVHHRD